MSFKYTADHEWLQITGEIATVGITHHAQSALGDLVFIELPTVGKTFRRGQTAGIVESVKAASDVYMPVDAVVVESNPAVVANPSLVNSDPQGQGWLFKIRITDQSQLGTLLDEAQYQKLCS